VYRYVFVSLLKTSVFLNEVQIISSDDNSPLHLHLLDNSCKDSASDVDWSGEWTFFVDVGSEDCLLGSLETKSNVFIPSWIGLVFAHQQGLLVEVDISLLLERLLDLFRF